MATWEMVSGGPDIELIRSGNLHLNIIANKYTDEVEKIIEPYIYEIVGASIIQLTQARSLIVS